MSTRSRKPRAEKPKSSKEQAEEKQEALEPVRIENKENNWSEDEDKKIAKYFKIYNDINEKESIFHLIGAMISSKSPQQIAVRLQELNVVSNEILYEHFPLLEIQQCTKSKVGENWEIKIETLLRTMIDRYSTSTLQNIPRVLPSELISWILSKMEDCIFNLSFHKMNLNSNPQPEEKPSSIRGRRKTTTKPVEPAKDNNIPLIDYIIMPLKDEEWKFLKNRCSVQIFHLMGFLMEAPTSESCFWKVPASYSLEKLEELVKILKSSLELSDSRKVQVKRPQQIPAPINNKENNNRTNVNTFQAPVLVKKPSTTITVSSTSSTTTAVAQKKRPTHPSPAHSSKAKWTWDDALKNSLQGSSSLSSTSTTNNNTSSRASTDDLDAIFASPVHKKTKKKVVPVAATQASISATLPASDVHVVKNSVNREAVPSSGFFTDFSADD